MLKLVLVSSSRLLTGETGGERERECVCGKETEKEKIGGSSRGRERQFKTNRRLLKRKTGRKRERD